MKKRSNFTLVELLVTMGVFCILLMVSMQIFGSARKLWVRSEQKNSAFAAARTAMEFVAARIQTCVYTEDMPFELSNRQGTSPQQYYTEIFFPTAVPMNREVPDGSDPDTEPDPLDELDIRFVGFSLNSTDGILEMRIFSDRKNGTGKYPNFARLLPPYRRRRGSGSMTYTDACSRIRTELANAGGASRSNDKIEIIENVTNFKLIPFNPDEKKSNAKIKRDTTESQWRTPPYLLEIEISVIDSKANFKKWKDAGSNTEKDEIETESGYTFRRAVLLGDRRNKR